jgi:hypothetical protein
VSYKNESHELHRFNVFKKNLETINWLNANDKGARYGVTKFADLDYSEFKAIYLKLRVPEGWDH